MESPSIKSFLKLASLPLIKAGFKPLLVKSIIQEDFCMSDNSQDRVYKRKVNEFEQELKRLTRELQKLKSMKKDGGRARKQAQRLLQREADLQEVFDNLEADQFDEIQEVKNKKSNMECRECGAYDVTLLPLGFKTVVVCKSCECRYTISDETMAAIA